MESFNPINNWGQYLSVAAYCEYLFKSEYLQKQTKTQPLQVDKLNRGHFFFIHVFNNNMPSFATIFCKFDADIFSEELLRDHIYMPPFFR
jgi:hypothetical protein